MQRQKLLKCVLPSIPIFIIVNIFGDATNMLISQVLPDFNVRDPGAFSFVIGYVIG